MAGELTADHLFPAMRGGKDSSIATLVDSSATVGILSFLSQIEHVVGCNEAVACDEVSARRRRGGYDGDSWRRCWSQIRKVGLLLIREIRMVFNVERTSLVRVDGERRV